MRSSIGNGGVPDAFITSSVVAAISISLVPSRGLIMPSGRAADRAGDAHDVLGPETLCGLVRVGRGLGVEQSNLHGALAVPQVDEGRPTVVSTARPPSRRW